MTNYLKGHITFETTKANDVQFLFNDSWTVSATTSVENDNGSSDDKSDVLKQQLQKRKQELIKLNNDRLLQSTRTLFAKLDLVKTSSL